MVAKELSIPDFLLPPFFKMAVLNFQNGVLHILFKIIFIYFINFICSWIHIYR